MTAAVPLPDTSAQRRSCPAHPLPPFPGKREGATALLDIDGGNRRGCERVSPCNSQRHENPHRRNFRDSSGAGTETQKSVCVRMNSAVKVSSGSGETLVTVYALAGASRQKRGYLPFNDRRRAKLPSFRPWALKSRCTARHAAQSCAR